MAAIEFHNYPTVTLVAQQTLATAADGTVIPFIKVRKGFRVLKVRVVFADLGSAQTADIGDTQTVDRYHDGIDTGTAAGSATWEPATSAGYLYTQDDVIGFKPIGATATGGVRIEVVGHFDYQ